jgi:hypothetical protein
MMCRQYRGDQTSVSFTPQSIALHTGVRRNAVQYQISSSTNITASLPENSTAIHHVYHAVECGCCCPSRAYSIDAYRYAIT